MHLARVLIAFVAAIATLAYMALPGGEVGEPELADATHHNGLLAPLDKCGGSKQTDTSLSASDQEAIMRCLHNYARGQAGQSFLAANSLLPSSSDAKTADMFRCKQFSHTACGHETLYHVKRVGYTSGGCWGAAENIAWGTGSRGSPRSIMSAWLHSDGHRANILNRRYRDVGFGLRKGTFNGYENAQVWTAHLGYRC
jgi:uncharacterized protein YkwD